MSRLTTKATHFVAALAITLSGTAVIGGAAQAGEIAPAGASTSALCYTRSISNGGWAQNNTCSGTVQYGDHVWENGVSVTHWANKARRGQLSSNYMCWGSWYGGIVVQRA